MGEVADRTAELALASPAGRVPDVGGPEVRTFGDLARAYFEAAGRRKRVVEVPVAGKIARALREGAQTAPDHRYGELRWEEFLDRVLHQKRGLLREELPWITNGTAIPRIGVGCEAGCCSWR